ncbi:Outer membrane scaffolding protein for murein synthesis, MipA/OmpV family [Alteromonadaceae bacterium Bs31]|nr:Outer membrane scaffolding protein for murein synthesis, MipA/OmpV family [Alteromonadaceae bacterium Bs31]
MRSSKFLAACYLALCTPHLAQAADIAGAVQNNGRAVDEDGGYFEIGFATGYLHMPYDTSQEQETADLFIGIDASFEFRKKGFFTEVVQGTQDGLNLGYTLWHNNTWVVDFLAASMNRFYDPDLDNKIKPEDDEDTRNKKLYNRNSFYLGTGLRISHYLDEYVIQYRLVTDTLDDNGVISTLRLGRGWQYRNWNFHCILSAQYTSAKTNNYWFGVEQWQATERYPAFSPDSSLSYSAQFGLAKPLSEKWVARLFTGWEQYPSEVRGSPFVDDSDGSYMAFTVSRVFSSGH